MTNEQITIELQKRLDALRLRDFATADRIRQELLDKRVIIEDAPGGVSRFRRF